MNYDKCAVEKCPRKARWSFGGNQWVCVPHFTIWQTIKALREQVAYLERELKGIQTVYNIGDILRKRKEAEDAKNTLQNTR